MEHEIPYGNDGGLEKPKRSATQIPSLDQYPVLQKNFDSSLVDGQESLFKTVVSVLLKVILKAWLVS